MAEPIRKMMMMKRVNRIFLRSSGDLKAFLKTSNTLDHLGLSTRSFNFILSRL